MNLDTHWREAIKKMEWTERYSLEWYRKHPITKELLDADIHWGHLIEFGCGIGARTFLARQLYPPDIGSLRYSITGVDGSPFAIDYAQKHWWMRGMHFHSANLLNLPWDANLFTNGYMLATIEHIKDTDKLLSECQRVIKPGGKIFVSVTESNFHSDKSHVEIYDKRKLRQKLAAIGEPRSIYVKDHIIYATVEVE